MRDGSAVMCPPRACSRRSVVSTSLQRTLRNPMNAVCCLIIRGHVILINRQISLFSLSLWWTLFISNGQSINMRPAYLMVQYKPPSVTLPVLLLWMSQPADRDCALFQWPGKRHIHDLFIFFVSFFSKSLFFLHCCPFIFEFFSLGNTYFLMRFFFFLFYFYEYPVFFSP